MKAMIFSTLIAIVAFFTSEISLSQRIILVGMMIILSITLSFNYIYKYLPKIKKYTYSYYSQIFLTALFSIYLILQNILELNAMLLGEIIIISIQFIILLPVAAYPIIMYGKGIYIFIPRVFRVPVSGRNLQLTIQNKIPLESKIDFELLLPSNVVIKNKVDNTNIFSKSFVIKGNSKLNIDIPLKSNQHNSSKKAKISLNSDTGIKNNYDLEIIT